jgi:hypothetical protein
VACAWVLTPRKRENTRCVEFLAGCVARAAHGDVRPPGVR